MKHKLVLAAVICVAVISVSFLFFSKEANISGAAVDLKTFNYSAVTDRESFPKVNVTGVIDNICLLPHLPLWDKVGGGQAGGKIAITVGGCPGTQMYVTDVQQYGNTTWYHVQRYENKNGLQMYWDGWIPEKAILQGPLPVRAES